MGEIAAQSLKYLSPQELPHAWELPVIRYSAAQEKGGRKAPSPLAGLIVEDQNLYFTAAP